MLKERTKTAMVLILALCFVLSFSHIALVINVTIAVLTFLCVLELLHTERKDYNGMWIGVAGIFSVLMAAVSIPGFSYVMLVAFSVAIVLFAGLMIKIKSCKKLPVWAVVFAVLFIAFSFKSVAVMRKWDFGLWILCFAILAGTVTDCGAYFVGRQWGNKKMAPTISPNKTREGSIGGTLATAVVFWLCSIFVNLTGKAFAPVGTMILYGICASCVGQFGDLSFSAIKRIAGVKDYGDLLPGHGGILDRVDSILFILPFTYLFCQRFTLIFPAGTIFAVG